MERLHRKLAEKIAPAFVKIAYAAFPVERFIPSQEPANLANAVRSAVGFWTCPSLFLWRPIYCFLEPIASFAEIQPDTIEVPLLALGSHL